MCIYVLCQECNNCHLISGTLIKLVACIWMVSAVYVGGRKNATQVMSRLDAAKELNLKNI